MLTSVSDLKSEPTALDAPINQALAFDDEVMVEKFIPGREFTVGIADGVALPVGEVFVPGDVFDYGSKYQAGAPREVFPAHILSTTNILEGDSAHGGQVS